MPEPSVARQPRRDTTAADAGSLQRMGRLDPQPTPAPAHPAPEPAPGPDDAAERAALNTALADAGVTATAEDRAAVQALAGLDAATVEAVTRWLKTKKPKPADET